MPSSNISYLLDGFKLIAKPGLRRYALIPLLINIVVFIALLCVSYHYVGELNQTIARHLPSWAQWLSGLVWLLFFIGYLLIFVYAFVTIGNIITAPFNSLLAEKVEAYLTGKTPTSTSLWQTIKDIPRLLKRQTQIIFYYLLRAIFLWLLFFIPVVQLFAVAIWFLFNAWIMSLQYLDYPTDNHKIDFATMKTFAQKQRVTSLSFGSCVLIASLIPILNFFVIPAAVAGATKWWVETK
ncbi:hypothetical protein AYO45_05120 [Gammaproteobacteria bacterium SCGC AG-212-F23]|nr:hypothetical protein AYO45_05120 [Gammaproteobacteria bacterium SCGC AG-212-F23]